jgi:hypothetical protein
MKKRILAMTFAVMMAFGVAACGGNTAESGAENAQAAEMQAQLQTYDAALTAEAAAEEGMFTIANGAVVSGQEHWDAFMAGETDSVMLCQFSAKGGAMLDYVAKQEDGSYLVVSDLTRDGYEYEEKEDYQTQVFTEIKVFENFTVQEGGTPHTVCVMTDDAELDAATFLQYWKDLSYEDNGAFMLFVI